VRIGPYELLDVAGQGQLGPVYHARHHETNQQVAVKIVTLPDPSAAALWEQHTGPLAGPRHPHAIDYIECGSAEGRPYLVMEWLPDGNLGEWFQRRAPLAEDDAVLLLRGLGEALDRANDAGIWHGAVNPENILLTADGRAKLSDLGLGEDLHRVLCQARHRTAAPAHGELGGVPSGEDDRGDVYGLGAVLYYAVTGVMPFLASGAACLPREVRSPREVNPALSEPMERAVCQALAPAPERRPACCADIFASLPTTTARTPPPQEEKARGAPHERRENPRFSAALGASCRPLLDQKSRWRGEIQDVSLRGIRLLLDRRFEPGVLLNVEVFDEQAEPIHAWLVQVRWVRELVAKKWSVGCIFNRELSADDLRALLTHEHTTAHIHAVA
jgi:serine/threonine protein kinase